MNPAPDARLHWLRPYQETAVSNVIRELSTVASTLVVLPTGCGKTVVFGEVARRWQTGRVLIQAHTEELVSQAAAEIAGLTGERPEIEMADQRANSGGFFAASRYVVASVQSLCRRLDRYDPADFGLIITDEAHHDVPSNAQYCTIRKHFERNESCRFLGVTATPTRADEKCLGQTFETVAHEYPLHEAINDGWLVPIVQQYVTLDSLDLSWIADDGSGELNQAQLAAVEEMPECVKQTAAGVVDHAGARPTLVFAVNVTHAEHIAELINYRLGGMAAHALSGKTDKLIRRETLQAFERGEFQFLVGCQLFTEGFNSPRISCVANACPTKSTAKYTQCVGRGTRVLRHLSTKEFNHADAIYRRRAIGSSDKRDLLVLDFVGNSGRHKLISTADILGGEHSEEARLRAVEKAKKDGKPVEMGPLVRDEQIQVEIEVQIALRREEERERQEAERKKQARLKAQATYTVVEVDPFDGADVLPMQGSGITARNKPTAKQAACLRKNGYNPDGMTKAQAGKIIGDLKEFWAGRRCSPAQSTALESFGEPGECGKEKASALLTLLRHRGFRPRDYRLTRDRLAIKRQFGKYTPLILDPRFGEVAVSPPFGSEADARQFLSRCLEQEEHGRRAA